ncbi:Tigger transposable element-derived protein 1-like 93, partial [Homarus americanus]
RPATTSLTTPKAKKSRQAITLEQKIKVLEALQRGNGASSVGRQFGLSESSVRTIKLNNKKIRAAYVSPVVAKAFVLMDNASSHSKHLCIVNTSIDINLTFFPPNVTSLIQPLDQGVIALFKRYYLKNTKRQMAEAMNKDNNVTAATVWKSYTIKDVITNITLAWKSVPETALNGVWHNLWPEVVHDFKGFDEGKDVKDIMKLVKEVRGDPGFQEIQEVDVTELLVSMEDPLTSEEVLEMAKKHEEEEEATDKPQTVGKELTIPKLGEFMQHVTSATQSALQHDPDMERSMQVVEALNQAASTYSQLLDQLIMAQQQKKIISFFRPLSSSAPEVAGPSTSGQTRLSSSASRVSDVSTATPLDSDVDDVLVELGSAYSEDELPY